MPVIVSKKKKTIPVKNKKAKVLKFLSSVQSKDVFPRKNKKAEENLKHAGLI
jgi:hypothetical protein